MKQPKNKVALSMKQKKISQYPHDPTIHRSVIGILNELPRERTFLIEALHKLQDKLNCLPHRYLAELANEYKLSMTEVFETATFYHHFDVVADDDQTLPEFTVRICDSLTCSLYGAERLLAELRGLSLSSTRILRAPCMGGCDHAPIASVGKNQIFNASTKLITEAVNKKETSPRRVNHIDYNTYLQKGGYKTLLRCLKGSTDRDKIIKTIENSGLRGLGGAGFATGQKWRIVSSFPGPRLMAVNADEGEPGTFKDRYLLETDPHRFLEGVLIGNWVVQAEHCYIYVRDEYPTVYEILDQAIRVLEQTPLLKGATLHLRRGAGAYICGEETAMLESIEGKRGLPRHKPPFAAEVGLFGQPTLINNVETLFWVRDIIENGADWFSERGRNGQKGIRAYSVSGRVRNPGVKITDAGITVRELIDEYCGGLSEGHTFKGYLPGGASGGILPASMDDIPLAFGTLEEYGCLIGSGAIIILSDQDSTSEAAINLMKFFEEESCGQCTPCRSGCEKSVTLMASKNWNKPLLLSLSRTMADASICGLGQAAPNAMLSVLKYFPEDIDEIEG